MILTARDAERATVEEVGGKGASLFRLVALGAPVPPFFVIAADAHRATKGELTEALKAQIVAEWRALVPDGRPVAVRSSGIAEDGADNSFAGVFETILDVTGEAALLDAVVECWRSHDRAEAQAYRAARALDGDDSAMAVVVQVMIDAEWSGVSFTADPVSGALSVTLVNAVEGQGEQLVSGLVNPVELRVDTATGRVLDRNVPPGGRDLPEAIRQEVVALSTRVAGAYGFPQDLEWASEGGRLWLLQSRPITTLAGVFHDRPLEPWAPAGDPDAPDRIWTRAYADEIWTPPVSPVFYDVQYLGPTISSTLKLVGDTAPIPPDIFKYHRAAAYLDASLLRRMYAGYPPIMRRPGIYGLLPEREQALLRAAPLRRSAVIRRIWRHEIAGRATKSMKHTHEVLAASWDGFRAGTAALYARDLAALDDAALSRHFEEIWRVAGSVAVLCGYAVFNHAHDLKLLLTGLLDKWLGDGDELYGAASAGLSDGHTVREADEAWGLAQHLVRTGPAAVSAARATSYAAFASRPDARAFVAAFEDFRFRHRHRGANYKDPIHPRWGDDPELLWSVVVANLADGVDRPLDVNRASGERRRKAQADILARLSGPLAPLRRAALRKLLHYNEIYAGIRDDHRFYYDEIWSLLRLAFLERGRRLHADGKLAAVEDIFFVNRTEQAALADGSLDATLAAARIASRRADYARTRVELPPKFLVGGYTELVERTAGSGEGLGGIAASPGHVVATARVIHDVRDLNRVAAGDILVTRQTDPGWTPAFARLGGLVLETGGVLAHGASLCREFAVPCVTAVENATRAIPDGAVIELSGSTGRVRIVRAPEIVPQDVAA